MKKFKDLRLGDGFLCLRVYGTKFVCFWLTIQATDYESTYHVISDNFDKYTIMISGDSDINGSTIILFSGGEYIDEELKEYAFETLEDCKKFAIDYCQKKVKEYEQAIQSIESW